MMIPRYQSPFPVVTTLSAIFRRNVPSRGIPGVAAREHLELFPSASDGLIALLQQRATSGTVVMPAYTCIRVVDAVREAGWFPAFVDVSMQTGAMDTRAVVLALERLAQPLAILATHLHGIPTPVAELRELADARGAFLIEDCAMAQGALQQDRDVGGVGDAAIYSFGTGKVVSVGIGGAVTAAKSVAPDPCVNIVSRTAVSAALLARAGRIGIMRTRLQDIIKKIFPGFDRQMPDRNFRRRSLSKGSADVLRRLLDSRDLPLIFEERRSRSERWIGYVNGLGSARIRSFQFQAGDRPCCPGLPLLVVDRQGLQLQLKGIGVDTAKFFAYCAAEVDGDVRSHANASLISTQILLLPMDSAIDVVEAEVRELLREHAIIPSLGVD